MNSEPAPRTDVWRATCLRRKQRLKVLGPSRYPYTWLMGWGEAPPIVVSSHHHYLRHHLRFSEEQQIRADRTTNKTGVNGQEQKCFK